MIKNRLLPMLSAVLAAVFLCAPLSPACHAQESAREKTVTVTVTDESGTPLPHIPIAPKLIDPRRDSAESWISVNYRTKEKHLDETDENGVYTFRTKSEGERWIYVQDGFFQVPVGSEEEQDFSVTYAPSDFSVTFNFLDEEGNPVENAFLRLVPQQLVYKFMKSERDDDAVIVYADQNGQYVWENAATGAHYLEAGNSDVEIKLPFVIGPNQEDLTINVTLSEAIRHYPFADRVVAFQTADIRPLKNKPVYQAAVSYPGGELVPFREKKTNDKGELKDVLYAVRHTFLADGIPVDIDFVRGKEYYKVVLPRP